MQKIILITILVVLSFISKANAQKTDYGTEWSYRQDALKSYEVVTDNSLDGTKPNVFKIKSIKNKVEGFGNIMKTVPSEMYLGKTIKMTGYIKSENVKSWAGLWMRVDYYDAVVLAFDNMQRRGVRKTTDWTKYEVVLFVPLEATSISYGVLLDGTGQIWFKDASIEVVDDTIAETGRIKGRDHKVISFEKRAKAIGDEIKKITDIQKNALKDEIDTLDKEVEKGLISKQKGEELKLKKAEERAANIDAKVAIEERKLSQVIQDQVDGKLEEESDGRRGGTTIVLGGSNDSIELNKTEINLTSMKVYNGHDDKLSRHYKRTTSQIVFATGLNNLVTDKSVENSDFRYIGSHFYEWGLTFNTRVLDNHNLLHAKYGLSVMYNNLRATDNRSFVVNGNQTNLEVNPINQEESRFRTVSLVVPVHLEFDFSGNSTSDGKTFFKTHDSFRVGFGGYFGTNLKSKQIIKYDEGDYKFKEKLKGDFNVSNFIYGVSTYVGYKSTSLYLKYDLNPLFTDNIEKQNNVSLGVRFDFN